WVQPSHSAMWNWRMRFRFCCGNLGCRTFNPPSKRDSAGRPDVRLAGVSAQSPEIGRKSRIARFGLFEADLDARELRKQGRRIRLQEQPFAVLVILLERPGSVISREDIRQKLWPADTFVDFDHSLNTAVNKIRETLGDSAG